MPASHQPAAACTSLGDTSAAATAAQGTNNNDAPLQVWGLMLEQWRPLDTAVVCKLLCVSQAMAGLVHSLCAGKLCVTIEHNGSAGPPALLTSWPQYLAPPRWLARNAMLLESCTLGATLEPAYNPPVLSSQGCTAQLLAAGLAAASAASGSSKAPADGSSTNAAQVAVEPLELVRLAAINAAAKGGNSSSSPNQGLLLKRFESKIPTSGHLLCAIAGSTQLTQLNLQLTDSMPPPPGVTAALASLKSLKGVTIIRGDGINLQPLFDSAAAAFSHLQALTALEVGWFCSSNISSWPPSLQRLGCGDTEGGIDLSHMQHLTSLDLGLNHSGLPAPDRLPHGGLKELRLTLHAPPGDLQSLLHFTSLTKLHLGSANDALGAKLQVLEQLTALKEVSVGYFDVHDEQGMVQAAQHLSKVPLKSLDLYMVPTPQDVVGMFGSYTQLTFINLDVISLPAHPDALPVVFFANQLKRMRALQVLSTYHLQARGYDSPDEGEDWGPVTIALCGLPALRSLKVICTPLGVAAARLAAATQLTHLELGECALDGDVIAAVRAGLAAHLLPEHLVLHADEVFPDVGGWC